jgi:hypothetical protein
VMVAAVISSSTCSAPDGRRLSTKRPDVRCWAPTDRDLRGLVSATSRSCSGSPSHADGERPAAGHRGDPPGARRPV